MQLRQKGKRILIVMAVISLLVVLGGLIWLFYWTSGFGSIVVDGSKPSKELIAECKAGGATIKTFGDSCVSDCDWERSPVNARHGCFEALTPGCYCGSGKCWNIKTKMCEPL